MSHAPIPNGADPLDLLGTDTLLNDEERLLRDTVRKFVADKVLPDVGEWFDAGTFPNEMAKEFGALGVLGMHLDGYGCAGTSATAYGLACTELEFGDSGVRSFVSVQGSRAMFVLASPDAFNGEQKKPEALLFPKRNYSFRMNEVTLVMIFFRLCAESSSSLPCV
jgi:glutaryl-CoA dehydrogenase